MSLESTIITHSGKYSKIYLIVLLVLIPFWATSQSKKSNELYQRGLELYEAEKYEEALRCFVQSDSLDKAKLKPTSENFYRAELKMADCYKKMADYYKNIADYAEAIRLQTYTVDIRKKALGDQHPDYATALHRIAMFYDDMGQYNEAIRIQNIALDIRKKTLGEEHIDYAKSLNNLSTYYKEVGNYDEAIKLAISAIEIFKKLFGEEHPHYATMLRTLANNYDYVGNYTDAMRLATTALEINKKLYGEGSLKYAEALSTLSKTYIFIGNYTEAIRLGTAAAEIKKKNLGEQHPQYAVSLHNLATNYARMGDYNEAIRLASMAMEIRKVKLGEEHPKYAMSLRSLAAYNAMIGNYATAISIVSKASDICKKNLGEGHPDYAESLCLMAGFYSHSGDYNEAINTATHALDIFQKVLGPQHPKCAEVMRRLADYNLMTGNYGKAVDWYSQSCRLIKSFILKTFSSMTSRERSNFWNIQSEFFSKNLPYAAYKHPDTTLNALAYDALVFSKGLLLNAELEIQNLVEKSGDTTFFNRYYKIQQDRAMLDKLYLTTIEDREKDADSLAKVIDSEERLLVESSKALGDYTKNLSIDWHDVQKNLKDNDLAIEFACVKDTAAKQLVYLAFVLKKGMDAPHIVNLFNIFDFFDIDHKDYYNTPKLYNLVWKPLEKYLEGVKTVYFSPAGQIHTIGVEYLPDANGKIFAEKFDTYRLSSTRELVLQRSINPDRKASTYGGIKYDFSEDDWQKQKAETDSIRRSFRDIPILSGNSRANGMEYLEGTKQESATVAQLLRAADYEVKAMSDAAATEESFKQLSGSGIKVLHIGTHGFYETEENLKNANMSFYTSSEQSDEDRSLSCSGLLFAGANSVLDPTRRNEIPEDVDDGILTAKEISRLDFNGLDLVVLSACQTGLGEITSEGVFGLQRGFKKAGAQTIVMSLWKVADESTQLLMVNFFKNLTAGQSKRAAFLAAQKTVRAKFPNPLYWAAFVMVDGRE
ncbi:MAG: CHAT domain-containing protein [Bacteroidales bacterium]|nr:CHAT domain-containing protein [Bacteroidales bacterium]